MRTVDAQFDRLAMRKLAVSADSADEAEAEAEEEEAAPRPRSVGRSGALALASLESPSKVRPRSFASPIFDEHGGDGAFEADRAMIDDLKDDDAPRPPPAAADAAGRAASVWHGTEAQETGEAPPDKANLTGAFHELHTEFAL